MTFRHTRIAAIGVGALLLTAALAGCGGGGGSGALSKEDFITQADQICAEFRADAKETEDAFNAAAQENDLKTATDLFAENTEKMDAAAKEFAALTPPEEDQETIDEFISLSRQQVETANELLVAIRAGDETALRAADESAKALDGEADLIADKYGMVDCGSAGG